jgi:hypothetical protein
MDLQPLQSRDVLLQRNSPRLQPLCKHSGGLHKLDMVLLTIQMSQYYEGTPDIPKYIFLLEGAQCKTARACLPVTNQTLIVLASTALLAANTTSMMVFFLSLQTKLRMSLQGCIVHLLLTYDANTHKARNSDLVYLVTWNAFTLLLGHKWTYVATVHSLSHQEMTQASDQLHTTSFCSPPVLGNTRNTCNTCNA